jgi:AbiV family abortive infection protein
MKNLTVDAILDGMIKITLNAQSLVEEGEILYKNKYYARTYTLAHIAREEISKLYMLYKVGIEIIAGKKFDHKKLEKRLRNHKSKIQFFSMPVMVVGLDSKYVEGVNKRKNDSLYVGYENEIFKAPSENITEHIAKRTLDLATYQIIKFTNIHKLIETLDQWNKAPKEEFEKVFGKIIYKTNEELVKDIDSQALMQSMSFIENKLVDQYYTTIQEEKHDS